ncbi:hypothetical protein PG984_005019, partial [Apiospora sp. TS-2023a]
PGAYSKDETEYHNRLLDACPAGTWPYGSYLAACPRPVLVCQHHQRMLQEIAESLTAVIMSIVERWWTDHDAGFPRQMPLEEEEKDILRWIDHEVSRGSMASYRHCSGAWRPGFLIRMNEGGEERFQIAEINACFAFNGLMHLAYGQAALNQKLGSTSGFVGATDPEKVRLVFPRFA